MKGKEIKELQNNLFDHLEPYFILKGYLMDRKVWNIDGPHHSINLFVNTTDYDRYSLRPGITIVYKSLFENIQEIVKTDDFNIFYNAHFDIYQKLANVFYIHNFDECFENKYNRYNNNFTLYIENDNTLQVANRLIEFMESFLWKTIESTSNLDNLYEFLKNLFLKYLDDVETNKTKIVTQFVQGLDVNGYLSLVYLGLEKKDHQIYNIITRLEQWHNDERSLFVIGAKKLTNHFNNI